MQRIISFLSGLAMGALVGATLALLLAPSSGEQMRTQIQERSKQLSDEVRQAAAARRTELEQQLASLRAPQKGA
ncbi:MAG: YtxH domain-containing protein [Anaerolineales bacterium]|nr:YtxH domain-containing protein [Anaerolineales bacterium]